MIGKKRVCSKQVEPDLDLSAGSTKLQKIDYETLSVSELVEKLREQDQC